MAPGKKHKTDEQEHREAMEMRRVSGGPYRQEPRKYTRPGMKMVRCCSCRALTDANDKQNVRVGIAILEGVRCQTCHEAGKPMGRRML